MSVAVNYFRARKEQMRYEEYKKEGLPIGSGAVESTCKQMVMSNANRQECVGARKGQTRYRL